MVFSWAGNSIRFNLLEFLDSALYLLCLGGLVAEAIDEEFEVFNLFPLVAIGRLKLRLAFGFLGQIAFVVPAVKVGATIPQLENLIHRGIQKVTVVGDQDEGVRILNSDTVPTSCGPQDRGDSSARPAIRAWA